MQFRAYIYSVRKPGESHNRVGTRIYELSTTQRGRWVRAVFLSYLKEACPQSLSVPLVWRLNQNEQTAQGTRAELAHVSREKAICYDLCQMLCLMSGAVSS